MQGATLTMQAGGQTLSKARTCRCAVVSMHLCPCHAQLPFFLFSLAGILDKAYTNNTPANAPPR